MPMKYIFAAVLFVLTAVFSKEAANGIRKGLEICMSMVIPSLFPLMFTSLLIMRTGIAYKLSRVFSKPAAFLFKMPKGTEFTLFAALCGGYPAGAAAVKELYISGVINKKQAERLALISVSAGPAFVLGAVGSGIYKSTAIGFMLLVILCVSVFAVGGMLSLFVKKENAAVKARKIADTENAFVSSAYDSAKTMLSICVFVVLFAYIQSLTEAIGLNRGIEYLFCQLGFSKNTAQAILPCIMEVSAGCIAGSKAGFPMVAFALGFGGLSVHFQIFSVLKDIGVNKLKFIFIRFIQGVICAVLTYFTIPLLPKSAVETILSKVHFSSMPTVSGSVCLIIMCFMLLLCLPEALTKSEKLL